MDYLWLKSLHIIFVITWFAGLFYIVRLFIYQREAQDKPANEKDVLTAQFKIMSRRLWYGITWPSAIVTLILATSLLWMNPAWLKEGWMQIKLGLVFLLYLYHFQCHRIFRQLQKDTYRLTSMQLRIFNEVATLFLFAIVFLVVLKSNTDWLKGLGGLIGLAILLMLGIKIYKNRR